MLPARTARTVFLTAVILSLSSAHAAVPDYKFGDVAVADVITPVPLIVVNPEATEALKQKVAQQVPFIVRHTAQSTSEAEAELRESIVTARRNFMTTLQRADLESQSYVRTIREVAASSTKDLPFDKVAPLWVRGQPDDQWVESLLQPVREVMAQPIVASKTDNTFPANQMVRLISVKNANEAPAIRDLESTGTTVAPGKVISLWRAKRLVETHFPAGQEDMGKFAASFVRTNAYADPASTELLRARRMEGVTVNDTYDAAQVIVRQGQTIDRKALNALAMLREKSLIGTLQVKLEQEQVKLEKEQSVAGQIKKQTNWIAASLGIMCVALILILWRLRSRPSTSLSPVLVNPALVGSEQQALPDGTGQDGWRARAIMAEGKAERAHEAIRSGVLGWMRERIFQTLFRHRAELLSVQQKAEAEMRELEQRLEQFHTPLQERIIAYEKRIEELEQDLAAKGEENRELIGARINVVRQHLTVERERFGIN
jgi:hypothetical protein